MTKTHLTNATIEKNYELYTQYPEIQKEIEAYLEYNLDTFRVKTDARLLYVRKIIRAKHIKTPKDNCTSTCPLSTLGTRSPRQNLESQRYGQLHMIAWSKGGKIDPANCQMH